MKSINKTALAALLALSSAGLASAQTYHVTGSTAYRVADVTAEVAVCGGATAKATYYGSSLTGANYSVVTNSSGSIKFENFFNGSIAGDQALVKPIALTFPTATDFPPTTISTAGSNTVAANGGTIKAAPDNGTLVGSPYATETVAPDLSFSDVSFATAQQIIKAAVPPTNNSPAGSVIVGIVPFVFVANGSSDVTSKLTGLSMDAQKFTYGWSSIGSEKLSFFTGSNADEAITVFPLGRDVDSGTRATALAETGYTLNGSGSSTVTQPVVQYYPYATQTAADNNTLDGVVGLDAQLTSPTIGALNFVPAETVDGYFMDTGDGGYLSGGNLATGMSTAFSGVTNTAVVTYLGVSDAKAALTASGTNRQAAKLMAYNGITFDPTVNSAANSSKIYEGQYTFWGYENLFYKSGFSGIAGQLQTALIGGLDQLSSTGVTFAGMKVNRADDGLNVQ